MTHRRLCERRDERHRERLRERFRMWRMRQWLRMCGFRVVKVPQSLHIKL